MDSLRLFVALALPDIVRTDLAAVAAPVAGIQWVPEQNLHLTLRFIGERTAGQGTAFGEALARVRVEPFLLAAQGLGVFPPGGRAKVLWAGLGQAHTRLFQLRQQVDDALLSVSLEVDVRKFNPHITLGRLGETLDDRALAQLLKRHEALETPPFRVDEFHLFASAPSTRGPVYSVVRTFPLHKD